MSIDTPSPPDWARPLIGQQLPSTEAATTQCDGFVDKIATVYKGARPGVGLVGWGWDVQAHKPLQRFLVVDPSDTVIGAGHASGQLRPDVETARAGVVTTPQVGWQATAQITSGQVKVYGLTDSGAPCLVGTLAVRT
ncbi:MAG: hypothetical protein WA840_05680 [Caulobacteraceae bacterium]